MGVLELAHQLRENQGRGWLWAWLPYVSCRYQDSALGLSQWLMRGDSVQVAGASRAHQLWTTPKTISQ